MKRIPTQIVKDRSRRLTKLFESFTPYTSYIGQTLPVWFDIETSIDHSNPLLIQSVGHTKAYVKVLVPYQDQLPGSCYEVEIIKADRFHIEGRIKRMIYPPNMHLQKTPVLASGGSSNSNSSSGSANGRSKTTATTLATIEEDYGDHQVVADSKKGPRSSGSSSNMRPYMLMTGVAVAFWLIAQRGSRVHS
jgi:threonylcarbamoyladenosine tRNA methylthiotransferase CDKAL1